MASTREYMDDVIYKIVDKSSWEDACDAGTFLGSQDDLRDGFIHFSAAHQLAATARKYFTGKKDLLLVAFAASQLGDRLKWETSRNNELFPHLYGPLTTSRALFVRELALGPDQAPDIPKEVAPRGPNCSA